MIILGLILLVLGLVLGIGLLKTLGLILLAIGVVLLVVSSLGHPVGGRRYWY